MLIEAPVTIKALEAYHPYLENPDALLKKAELLKGKKILHINSTPEGGGVAEILKSLIPLERALGLDAHWYYLVPDAILFSFTKKVHNALQGKATSFSESEKEYYLAFNKRLAAAIETLGADLVIIHDPQPLAARLFLPHATRVAARIHMDMTRPDQSALEFLQPILQAYEKTIFTAASYAPAYLSEAQVVVSAPAIDPLSPKNTPLAEEECVRILHSAGIDPAATIIAQVARFDPWKDQRGTIDAYRAARASMQQPLLVLAGIIEAKDDPEAFDTVREVESYANGEKDILLFHSAEQLRGTPVDLFINALQQKSTVLMQKSTQEGFGMAITEAMWKGRPVIGGDVKGIRLQIQHGENGFLAASAGQAALYIQQLAIDPALANQVGARGHATVEQKFLMPRLLEDELDVMLSLL